MEGLIDGGAYFRNFTVWSVLSVEVCLIYSSSDNISILCMGKSST